MDLNGLKERFNLQKLAEDFKSVIDGQAMINLDTENPIGQGIGEMIALVKEVVQLQDQQRKAMDRILGILGALAKEVPAPATADKDQKGDEKAEGNEKDNDQPDEAAAKVKKSEKTKEEAAKEGETDKANKAEDQQEEVKED